MTASYPVVKKERIALLDSLRGMAVLGILLMNIPYFALPDPAQFYDLAVLNEMGTINEKVWLVITWVLNGTQRALFALLFGAGIILFTQRQEQKEGNHLAADYYFRRQLWLVVFGLINFYILLWIGDYLVPYAICGMILYAFRKKPARFLLTAAFVCLLLMLVRENLDLYRNKLIIRRGEVAATVNPAMRSPEQKENFDAMQAMKKRSSIESRREVAENSIRKMQGDLSTLYKYQTERGMTIFIELAYYQIWSLLIFMFIGMAFYKNGVLTGKASAGLYWALFLIGMGVGLALSWYRIDLLMQTRFNRYEFNRNTVISLSEAGRVFRSLGIFGFIMMLYKSGLFSWLFSLLRPVGQMAFTNYLAQSFLMGLFFYGIGFGMLGRLERYELYYVVAATWVVQILFSHLWLRYFQFGPLEWIWRQLTYWKRFPLGHRPPGIQTPRKTGEELMKA